jgi:hypothetical protein
LFQLIVFYVYALLFNYRRNDASCRVSHMPPDVWSWIPSAMRHGNVMNRAALCVTLLLCAACRTVVAAPMSITGSVSADPGEKDFESGFAHGNYGYFGTGTDPAIVVKFDLSTMTRVDSAEANPGEVHFHSGFVLDDGVTGFLATETFYVVRFNLNTMTRTGFISSWSTEENFYCAVTDGTRFGWFGTTGTSVVKFDLQLMARVSAVTGVGALEKNFNTALLMQLPGNGVGTDPVYHGFFAAYPGNLNAAVIVKFDLVTMTRLDAVSAASGEYYLSSAVLVSFFGYFGTYTAPGTIVKFNLKTMTRIGAVSGIGGEDNFRTMVVMQGYAFAGTTASVGKVVRFDLKKMERTGVVTAASSLHTKFRASAVVGGLAFFATDRDPGAVIRVDMAIPPPTASQEITSSREITLSRKITSSREITSSESQQPSPTVTVAASASPFATLSRSAAATASVSATTSITTPKSVSTSPTPTIPSTKSGTFTLTTSPRRTASAAQNVTASSTVTSSVTLRPTASDAPSPSVAKLSSTASVGATSSAAPSTPSASVHASSSSTVSREQPLSATRTTTVPAAPAPAPPAPAQEAVALPKAVRDVAEIASFTTGILSPTSGMALQRSQSFTPRKVCAPDLDEPLSLLISPTTVAIGSGSHRYFVGAAVMNPVCLLAVVLIFLGIAHALPGKWLAPSSGTGAAADGAAGFTQLDDTSPPGIVGKFGRCVAPLLPSAQRVATVRLTHITLCVSLLLLQGTTYVAAVLLAGSGVDAGLRVLGGAVLALEACCVSPVIVWAFGAVPPAANFVKNSGRAKRGSVGIVRMVRWLVSESGDWLNTLDDSFFVETYGPLFWDYEPDAWWFTGAEFVLSVVLALGEVLGELAGCLVGGFVGLVAVVVYGAIVVRFRPHLGRIDLGFSLLLAALLIASACCNVSYHLTGFGAPAADAAGVAASMIEIAALVLMAYQGWRALNRLSKVYAPPRPEPVGTALAQLLMAAHGSEDGSENGGADVSSIGSSSENSDLYLLDGHPAEEAAEEEDDDEGSFSLTDGSDDGGGNDGPRRIVSRNRRLQRDAADILGLGGGGALKQIVDEEQVDEDGVLVVIPDADAEEQAPPVADRAAAAAPGPVHDATFTALESSDDATVAAERVNAAPEVVDEAVVVASVADDASTPDVFAGLDSFELVTD